MRTLRWCGVIAMLGAVLLGGPWAGDLEAQQTPPTRRILVYTRNYTPHGAGYVHANIADSVAALQRIGDRNGIAVDVSEDPGVFTDMSLSRYGALVFSNSNNEAFATQAQRDAFQRYIHAGHGFVGLHSASGSERDWPYFQQVLGGHFAFHPQEQSFVVEVVDPAFPAARGLPGSFLWTDECYFLDRLNPDLHVVLATRRAALLLVPAEQHPERFPDALPLAWWHTFDNSREFYLALGHNPADYRDPLLVGILEGGVRWAVGAAENTGAGAAGVPASGSSVTRTSARGKPAGGVVTSAAAETMKGEAVTGETVTGETVTGETVTGETVTGEKTTTAEATTAATTTAERAMGAVVRRVASGAAH